MGKLGIFSLLLTKGEGVWLFLSLAFSDDCCWRGGGVVGGEEVGQIIGCRGIVLLSKNCNGPGRLKSGYFKVSF